MAAAKKRKTGVMKKAKSKTTATGKARSTAKTKAKSKVATKAKAGKVKSVRKTRAARTTTRKKSTTSAKASTHAKCKHCNKKFEKTALIRSYCRLCYIATWKTNRLNKQIKAEQRLNTYVDRLVRKYPKDYLEKLKEGLENENKFQDTVEELDTETTRREVEDDDSTDNEFLEKFVREIKIED